MKKTIIGLLFILMAVPVQAHLYDNDFETHTVGLNVVDEQYEGWNWYSPGAVPHNGMFADDGGNTVLDLVGGQTHLNIHGYAAPDNPFLTDIHLNYEFDIKIFNFARFDIYFTDNVTSDVIAPSFNRVTSLSGSVSYKTKDINGVNTQVDVAVPGFVIGEWAHVSIQLNQLEEHWSMNLAGTQIATNAKLRNEFGNGGNWAVDTERIIFEVPGSVLIDNIVITVYTDDVPPTPDPATFSSVPFALSDTEITMTATVGADTSGPVEYLFTETTGGPGATSSIWQTDRTYIDSGLTTQTQYTYTVQMRDSIPNTGTVSSAMSATTDDPADKSPDIDGDGEVDLDDASILFSQWLFQGLGLSADLDNSEQVDFIDFAMLAARFGESVIYIDSVPTKSIEDVYSGTYSVTSKPADIITKGPWVDADAYPSFAAAISDITTAGLAKTLLIASTQDVITNITVPEFITLAFIGGGILDIDNTKTLTIAGQIQSPAAKIFQGPGNVLFSSGAPARKVYPEWWGAQGDASADDTSEIQAAIDSLTNTGGVVSLRPGNYRNSGITLISNVSLKATHRGTSRFSFTGSGGCITLANNCSNARVENLKIRNDASTSGSYAIDGRAGYIDNFVIKESSISFFQYGIYIEEGEDIVVDNVFVAGYGGGSANGAIGLKLGDYASGFLVNRATVKDVYITVTEIDFYNNASPCTIIRPIFETAQYAMENHSPSVLMAPFVAGIPASGGSYTFKIADNGMLFLGTANAEDSFEFPTPADRDKTSWLPDTFDSPLKIGTFEMNPQGNFDKFLGRKWHRGVAAPTFDTWSKGDIRWNTAPTAGGTLLWTCTSSGTPGTWKAFKIEN